VGVEGVLVGLPALPVRPAGMWAEPLGWARG
jgi:hypothetical protein